MTTAERNDENSTAAPAEAFGSTAGLGVCVLVSGSPVAWFRYHDQAEQWAAENYFGRWLMRQPVVAPEPAPWSEAELEQVIKLADELRGKFKEPRIADA